MTKISYIGWEILRLLSDQQRFSFEELSDKIDGHTTKSLRYTIRRLLENNLVQSVNNLADMRTVYYKISDNQDIENAMKNMSPELVRKLENEVIF